MRIPKLSKSSESEQLKSETENLSCLFCSHTVKNANLAKYENHLVQRHNLEKHIQQTILDTFNGQKRNLEKKNDELFSLKSVKDVMESMEKINKEKIKGTFKKTIKDKGVDPFKDLLDFVEKSEKDFVGKSVKDVERIDIKSESIGDNVEERNVVLPPAVEPVQYKCEECDKSYDRAAKLNFHTKKAHPSCIKITSGEKDQRILDKQDTDQVIISGKEEDQDGDQYWSDYLIFDCRVCLTKMPSSLYPDHLLTWHSLSLTDYQQKTGDSGACTPAEYHCLVCIDKIPWEKSSLLQHLATHKLTVDQYQVIFEKAIKKQVDKQTEMVKKGKTLVSPEKDDTACKDILENVLKEKTVSENNAQCLMCQKEFSTNFKLQRHVKSEHLDTSKATSVKLLKTETTAVKTEPTTPETKERFKCQICREEFPWTDAKVKEHLSQKHCLTKEFYFTLYGTSSGKKSDEKPKDDPPVDDKFACKDCIFSSSRKMALTSHVKKYHELMEEVSCCKEKFSTKWAVFVHLIENHKDKDKDLFAKFQVWQGLEKYYVSK